MHGTYLIEVGPKKGVTDPAGRGLLDDVRHLGLGKIAEASSAQLYRLIGSLSVVERERIARDLLCDPIIQDYHDGASEAKGALVIDVWYKPGVTDVIGESVSKGIRDLKIEGIEEVRTGMRYRLWGLRNKVVAENVAVTLLANPLVHDISIHAN